MHIPRSQSPVVSQVFAMAHLRRLPSSTYKLSAFLVSADEISMLSLWTTTIHFSEIGDAAHALITPGFIHILTTMHTGSFPDKWLLSLDGIYVSFDTHPLGNLIQFLCILADSKDLDLT